MKRKTVALLTVVFIWLVISAAALAASEGLNSSWWTVDGGGGPSSGGAFVLDGTIGQPDVGTMTGGRFSLSGGYWGGDSEDNGGSQPAIPVYLPVILR